MQAEVRPINVRGKPLFRAQLAKVPPSRGLLHIFENRLHALNRVVRCATLTHFTDGLSSHVLPELLDVEILHLEDKTMRLRGIEVVDGAYYGQTWDVRVL